MSILHQIHGIYFSEYFQFQCEVTVELPGGRNHVGLESNNPY